MILRITKKIRQWRLVVISLLVFFIFVISYPFLWPGGFGFGESRSITSTLEKDPQGVTTKYIEVATTDPGKTFWDWLSLLGVPISLLYLGSLVQQKQQERMERQQEQDSEAAKELQRQKSLKDYFNKVATLLLDRDFNLGNSKSERNYSGCGSGD